MDLKSRLSNARQKLLRRGSQQSASTRSVASSAGSDRARRNTATSLRQSMSMTKLPTVSAETVPEDDAAQRLSQSAVLPQTTGGDSLRTETRTDESSTSPSDRPPRPPQENATSISPTTQSPAELRSACPDITLQEPTPIPLPANPAGLAAKPAPLESTPESSIDSEDPSELRPSPARTLSKPTPPGVIRRQSLVTASNARVIKSLLEPDTLQPGAIPSGPPTADYFTTAPNAFNASMLHRKIWVKRPNASATLVQIREDDLVDDVRDMILKKYANSLGRSFDAPDVILRIHPRDTNSKSGDRVLGPEEEMCRTLDAYYPGGQTVNEALLIEVPQRRTPKPSPRIPLYYSHHDEARPYEGASEYFPPMPIVNPSPAAMTANSHEPRISLPHAPHSIAVLQTGQLPPLPSPGGTRRTHHNRPRNPRHNTASPTTLTGPVSSVTAPRSTQQRPRHDSSASEKHSTASGNPPIPTPPAVTETAVRQNSTPPTPRVSSPRPDKRRKKPRSIETPTLPAGLLDNSVPPINVLIVEDNIINLRVLGAFMQRLKVRWQRAMNGREAVTKWRTGGFHLVLMDIQLPIMNGLEATKEIRRLERVNSIGVFSSGSSEAPNNRLAQTGGYDREVIEDDKLGDRSLFKSPVIIVALTASSLQSDRHEALAAGCNDFLTKPVNFVWLERKVKEWGCMQALIDFDGWRKWKDFASQSDSANASKSTSKQKVTLGSNLSPSSASTANGRTGLTAANGVVSPTGGDEEKEKKKHNKRRSLGIVPPPVLPEESTSMGTPTVEE